MIFLIQIVLDKGAMSQRGRSLSGGRRIGCSSWKGIASCGLWGVSGNELRKRSLLEAYEIGFLSSFFKCQAFLKQRTATFN